MSLNVEMNRMLSQMQAMQKAASLDRPENVNLAAGVSGLQTQTQQPPGFGELFANAVDQVNDLSQTSGQLKQAFLKGEPGVDITRVMVASQKASIATSAVIQVRNKVVDSYKEIMNMPV